MRPIVPENRLLEQIASGLTGASQRRSSLRSIPSDALPAQISYSEVFLAALQKMLIAGMPRKLAECFGLREFHVLDDTGETHRWSVAHPAFWQALQFDLSQAGVDALWQLMRADTPCTDGLTDWDVLLLAMVRPHPALAIFSTEWLAERRVHWVVAAYILLSQAEPEMQTGLPWRPFFADSAATPIALRFLLVQQATAFYAHTAETLSHTFEYAQQCRFMRHDREPVEPYDPRHETFYDWLETAPQLLAFDLVRHTCRHWCGDGALGYDDGDYLAAFVHQLRFTDTIERLQALLTQFGRMAGDIS